MKIQQQILSSLESLLLHRTRTILSTLGIIFGVTAVVAMLSIGEGAKKETLEQIEQLGTNTILVRQANLSEEQHLKARQNASRGLTLEDAAFLKQAIPLLRFIAPVKVQEANFSNTSQEISPELLGVTRDYGLIKDLELNEGRFISDLDVQEQKQVAVLGFEVAQKLGLKGHVNQSIRINEIEYLIIGVLSPRLWAKAKNAALAAQNINKTVFIPLRVLPSNSKMNAKQEGLSEIILQTESSSEIEKISHILKRVLEFTHKQTEDYQIIIPQELLNQAYKTQQTFNLVLGSIAAISLLVGGIGIMNIMLANVSERTREIGIRRAVGANQFHIISQFLCETVMLTSIGALLGIAFGISATLIISFLAGWKTVVTTWSILLSLTMAIGVGLCAGTYPAIKAAAMDPIAALRHE